MIHFLAQLPGGAPAPEPLPHPEIPPPHAIDPGVPLWVWIVTGAVLVALIALLLGILLRKPAATKGSTERPLKKATRALKDLRNRADVIAPAEVGHEVSVILRRYYLERHGIPAPCQTSEELFPPVDRNDEPIRRRKWRERFEPLAAFYDALAYAPLPATKHDALKLVDDALAKLEEERLHEDPVVA